MTGMEKTDQVFKKRGRDGARPDSARRRPLITAGVVLVLVYVAVVFAAMHRPI
ncbi:hypothetical protein ACFRFL_14345 [Streptomyces sp. NPDC056708]|uniref:hypothetical protein n=1 Tax=unclassified Streptomyces TaxID=2593676 RepID=UPI0036CE222A